MKQSRTLLPIEQQRWCQNAAKIAFNQGHHPRTSKFWPDGIGLYLLQSVFGQSAKKLRAKNGRTKLLHCCRHIPFFSQRGAKGIIGTQCEVKEMLADAFIIRFFTRFLRQMSAGEALLKTRQQLLYEYLDPRGLVYSLFAAAELKLAQPVLNPEV